MLVTLFNSRAQDAPSTPVLLPVPILVGGGSYTVADATGTPIEAQVESRRTAITCCFYQPCFMQCAAPAAQSS